MTAALDLINLAARDAGLLATGQQLLGDDIALNLKRLNFMIAEWRRQRFLVYQLIDLSLTSTGANTYTVGPGGDFNTGSNPRPDKIEAAFFRQLVQGSPNLVDYPLNIIKSWEDYSQITCKTLVSFPQYVFLDTGFPLATLRPYPVPQADQFSIHLIIRVTLPEFANVSASVELPAEYMSCIQSNLAIRIATGYRLPITQEMKDFAHSTLSVLRGANAQIPTLDMPYGVGREGLYNIYSDSYY